MADNNKIPESMSLGIHLFSEKHWFKYSSVIAKNISVDAAIMFGILANLSEYHLSKRRKTFIENDFWIPIRYEFIQSRVFLTDSRQKRATEELSRAKFIKIDYKEGKRKWAKINWETVNSKMSLWYLEISQEPIENDGFE